MLRRTSIYWQYTWSIAAVLTAAGTSFLLKDLIGYRSVALILLLTLSLLSIRISLYPAVLAALLSAFIQDFFFIPPVYSLKIARYEDLILLSMYIVVAMVNIVLTARISYFEKMAREKEAKARALELYNTLFDALSHELRTPIATILGASDNLLAQKSRLSENDQVRLTQEINLAAERLERLTESLLNLSRLESGVIQPRPDWCDIGELIYTVVNRRGDVLKKHRLHIDVPADMPFVKLDFGLTEHILDNLIHNAAKHTPEGSRITIRASLEKNNLHLSIEDSGKGLSDEDKKRVFDKFFRSKNASSGGVGLGLSIVRGFVEAQGGEITVDDLAGGGTAFVVQLRVETLRTPPG